MKRLLLTVALSLVVAVAMAQVTTSSIRGMVTTDDNPLSGATIVALHTPSGTRYGTISNNEGHYSISGMRVGGPYEITISFIGYNDVIYKEINLSIGEPSTFDVELTESSVELGYIVVAGHIKNNGGKTFSRSDMEQIPSIDRSIYDLTNILSSAVAPAAGGIILGGQSSRYNAFTIDGTSSADIYGLGTTGMTGSLTEANPIPLDALDAVTISTSTVDLRESGFTGGTIKAVTRSGDNNFKGSAYSYYNNENFWGTTPGKDIKERKQLSTQTTNIIGATFGGPIIKNKLFFFVSGEFNRNITPSTNHPDAGPSALTLDEAKAISERYKERTGYDGGGWSEHKVKALTGSAVARLDWNINNENHFSLRYNMLYADADDSGNSLQSFKFRGAEYTNINRTHSVVAELNSVKYWGSNSLRVGYTRLKDGRTSPKSLPAVIINGLGESSNGSTTIGTDPYSGCTMLDQDVFIFGDDFNITRGKHNITVGTSNEIYRADNLYLANAQGTYTYNSLEDFLNDNASKYQYGYFANGKRNPAMTTGQFALYAQDRVTFRGVGELTYGLRADIPVMFDTPQSNKDFNDSAFGKHGKTGEIPRTQLLLSPRIGWEQDFDRKIKLRASTGIYTGRIPFVWLSNCYQNNGLRSMSVTAKSDIPPFSTEPESVGKESNPSIDIVDKNFRYPQVWRTAFGVEYRHYSGLTLGLDADYSKGLNNIYIENLVAQDNGAKVLFGGNDSTAAATHYDTTIDNYSAVYRLSNTDKGYSWSTTMRMEYDFMHIINGLRFNAAYTYAQSKSINDGISAQSSSNWGKTYAVDSNNPALSNSVYEFPHKVVASLSYSRRYGQHGTNIMLLYNGHSGEHYSLIYNKSGVDINNDTTKGNSLIYIPTEAEMESMSWADGNTSKAAFNDYIKADKYLSSHRGKFAERNSHSLPFVHRLDLHIAQAFYFEKSSSRRAELTLDVINLGNLLCRSWGMNYRTSNWALSPVTVTELQQVDDNYRPVYKFNGAKYTTDDILSRWHMQIGVRVVF